MSDRRTLVLIDGNALIHRAFHALPPLTAPDGEIVGAVYGFTSMLLNVIEDIDPECIAVAWDVSAPTVRMEQYADYKAHRPETDPSLKSQFPLAKEVVTAFNIPQFGIEGHEADDVIGTLAKQAVEQNLDVMIVTGDTDALQLVNDHVRVYTSKRKITDIVIYDTKAVIERYDGLRPDQLVDYRALKGDASDNIPGVSGIGEKGAITLLNEFDNLDTIYEQMEEVPSRYQKKLEADKDQAYMSRDLAQIQTDIDISLDIAATEIKDYDPQQVLEVFQRFGFKSLTDRLPASINGEAEPTQPALLEIDDEDIEAVDEMAFDPKIAVYLLTGQTGNSLDLSQLAFNYLGVNYQEDSLLSENKDKIRHLLKKHLESELNKEGNEQIKDLFYNLEMPLKKVLKTMEEHGVLVDKELLEKQHAAFENMVNDLEKQIYEDVGHEFNINSPKQLQEILFDELELPVLKKTKTQRSTDESVLQKLKDAHPVIPKLLEYRRVHKIKSTYLDPLPEYLDENNRVHTTFNQTRAASGRLSSEDPNLQNIPIGEGVELRKLFIAPEGMQLLVADYSQIELRIMAHITGEERLVNSFAHHQDIHAATAARLFDTTIDQITYDQRKVGKTINFALMYGMTPHGLAESLDIKLGTAQTYIDRFYASYPAVAQWQKEHLEQAKTKGYVETLYGRRRTLADLNSKNFFKRSAAERVAINHPLQGTQADLIKMAMVNIARKVDEQDLPFHMILQVHDELVFEVPKSHIQKAVQFVREEMVNVAELSVPIEVDVEIGDNWEETSKVSLPGSS